MNKKILFTFILVGAFLLISLVIPRESRPHDSTRVILEHSYHTYLAPSCFDDANPTNFIEETTYKEALAGTYQAHSNCTEKYYAPIQEPALLSWLKQWGLLPDKWANT